MTSWETTAVEMAFGSKTAALLRIPQAWRLPGLAIEACFLSGGLSNQLLEALEEMVRSHLGDTQVIVRSSAVGETLIDRGQFLSVSAVPGRGPELRNAIESVLASHAAKDNAQGMGILIQPYKQPVLHGHMANLRSVSKTRDHFEANVLYRRLGFFERLLPQLKFNSQRNDPPAQSERLRVEHSEDSLIDMMRSIGRYLATSIANPVSIEWLVDRTLSVWVLQCDDEADLPGAIDPTTISIGSGAVPSSFNPPDPFKPYEIGAGSHYHKLGNLDGFAVDGMQSLPMVAWAEASSVISALRSDAAGLARRLDAFAPRGLVIRTDFLDPSGTSGMNLARTDTVSGSQAVSWIQDQAPEFEAVQSPILIIHRFIPSRVAAWSYCDPDDAVAVVETLWGLPDGIQYYPHDSFQYDLLNDTMHRPTLRYKPLAVFPNPDGEWIAHPIRNAKARGQSLGKREVAYIAAQTRKVARNIDAPAQIMWFCQFPPDSPYAEPLPWYRERDPSPSVRLQAAPDLPETRIETLEDLKALSKQNLDTRQALIIRPSVDYLRSKTFLDTLIKVAQAGKHSIVLEGSTLAHAYHQLREASVPVFAARHHRWRTIKKEPFGKIVRDNIPDVIEANGDVPVFGHIPKVELSRQLSGKMIEELQEFLQAEGSSRLDELADVYEVLSGILRSEGVGWQDVAARAKAKRHKRGGFDTGTVLIGTHRPDNLQMPLFQSERMTRAAVKGAEALKALGEPKFNESMIDIPLAAILSDQTIEGLVGADIIEIKIEHSTLQIVIKRAESNTNPDQQLMADPLELDL